MILQKHIGCVTAVFHCVEMLTPPPNPRAAGACILVSLCVIEVAFSLHAIMKKDGSTDPDHVCVSLSQGEKCWSNPRKRTLSLGNVYQEFLIFFSEVGAKVSLIGE